MITILPPDASQSSSACSLRPGKIAQRLIVEDEVGNAEQGPGFRRQFRKVSATIRLVNDAPREVRESALPPLTDNTTGAGEKWRAGRARARPSPRDW